MTNHLTYWFPAKRYRWGWGLPSVWQGWVVMGIFPFWLVFYRWGIRQDYGMKTLYPAYTRYAEALSQRPSVVAALQAEGISLWE